MKKKDLILNGFSRGQMKFEVNEVSLLTEGSIFSGLFTPDASKAYVEFDICHSFPVVAGPASGTGNYIGIHPAVLARSHQSLLHQQTNLHHLIKAYDPKNISRDRIVGCVVATYYPPEPEGGWKIPATKEEAIPIKVCAVAFKQAEGVEDILAQVDPNKKLKQKFAVSIEERLASIADAGIYIPSTREIIPLLDASDELFEACISQNANGQYLIGKYKGEQLAFAYGAVDSSVMFFGVGYTPRPAEAEAKITSVRLEKFGGSLMSLDSQMIERMTADAGIDALIAQSYPGARMEMRWTKGYGFLPQGGLKLEASEENPVLLIKLANGKFMLKYESGVGPGTR